MKTVLAFNGWVLRIVLISPSRDAQVAWSWHFRLQSAVLIKKIIDLDDTAVPEHQVITSVSVYNFVNLFLETNFAIAE